MNNKSLDKKITPNKYKVYRIKNNHLNTRLYIKTSKQKYIKKKKKIMQEQRTATFKFCNYYLRKFSFEMDFSFRHNKVCF